MRILAQITMLSALTVTAQNSRADLRPAGTIIDVKMEQFQQSRLESRRSDGRNSKTTNRSRVLNISLRHMGSSPPEAGLVQWFFLAKDSVDGVIDYYSQGEERVTIHNHMPVTLRVMSDSFQLSEHTREEFRTTVRVRSSSGEPHGWVVRVLQNGRVIKSVGSTPDAVQWTEKNPPASSSKATGRR